MEQNNKPVKIGDFTELRTSDERYSHSMFLGYKNKSTGDSNGNAMHGEYLIDGVVMRFQNGLIHGGNDIIGEEQPAIVLQNQHTEWWADGVPHREEGPAIQSRFGNWEEFWFRGKLVMIRAGDGIEITMWPGTQPE